MVRDDRRLAIGPLMVMAIPRAAAGQATDDTTAAMNCRTLTVPPQALSDLPLQK
jgi:hypothetical protein